MFHLSSKPCIATRPSMCDAERMPSVRRTVAVVDGFFQPKALESPATLFRRFELAAQTWADFAQQLQQHPEAKVVYFVRHAQGTHNLAAQQLGRACWDGHVGHSLEYLDAELTPAGVDEARSKGPPGLQAELERAMPPIERVVVSPLSRAIQTAQHFFAEEHRPDKPFLCIESCREILDCRIFDKRQSLSAIKQKFPDVDVSLVEHEEDQLWSESHYETDEELQDRARGFLTELFDKVPDRHVAVVSHLCFIQAALTVVTGEKHPVLQNCEVVPLVLKAT